MKFGDFPTSNFEHSDGGFTLLETLVALLVLALSLGAAVQHLSLNSDKFARSQYSKSVSQLVDQLNSDDQIKRVIDTDVTRGEFGSLSWIIKASAQDGVEGLSAITILIEDKTGRNKPLFFNRLVSSDDYPRLEKETDG